MQWARDEDGLLLIEFKKGRSLLIDRRKQPFLFLAPVTGLEPVTTRLTVECATIAPHRNSSFEALDFILIKS